MSKGPTVWGYLGVDEAEVTLDVGGCGSVGLQVTGTYSGTISFEGSIDGVTYTALALCPSGSSTQASSTTGTGIWTGNVGGLQIVRARMSTYSSGTAIASLKGAMAGGGFR